MVSLEQFITGVPDTLCQSGRLKHENEPNCKIYLKDLLTNADFVTFDTLVSIRILSFNI